MADPIPSADSADPTNGATDNDAVAAAAGGAYAEQHTLDEATQTLSDTDQTEADSDQTSADADQIASDHDQAASDHDYAHGGDAEVHRVTRELRARSTLRREHNAKKRVEAAAARDAGAHARDLAALARDRAAVLRDRQQAARDAAAMGPEAADQLLRRVVAERAAAADSRARAAADRAQAARDREQAGRDRAQGRADRDVLLSHLTTAETDARNRGSGLGELGIEIERARRLGGVLVVAYIKAVTAGPVDGALGDAAAQALLRSVVARLRDRLRAYDLIVPVGDDALVCALSGVAEAQARSRFAMVQAALGEGEDPCRLTIGFAELAADDTPGHLIERAKADLPRTAGA